MKSREKNSVGFEIWNQCIDSYYVILQSESHMKEMCNLNNNNKKVIRQTLLFLTEQNHLH